MRLVVIIWGMSMLVLLAIGVGYIAEIYDLLKKK